MKIKTQVKICSWIIVLAFLLIVLSIMTGCENGQEINGKQNDYKEENASQKKITDNLTEKQPTPKDIDYSLERYNLIRRAYWVNGQREKANTVVCEVEKPLGYILLFTESGSCIGRFVVDGKVSSLNSYLTPDSEFYDIQCSSGAHVHHENRWLADVDGSYGENDNGIFFFTPDGKYIEWTGIYLYSDIPFSVESMMLKEE